MSVAEAWKKPTLDRVAEAALEPEDLERFPCREIRVGPGGAGKFTVSFQELVLREFQWLFQDQFQELFQNPFQEPTSGAVSQT